MSHKIIDGKKQAQIVKDEVRARVTALKDLGWSPRLVRLTSEIAQPLPYLSSISKAPVPMSA